MKATTEHFVARAREELKNERSRSFLRTLPRTFLEMREIGMKSFPDPAAAQAYAASIREEAIARLPELLEEFERNATSRGARVLWAKDDREACDLVVGLARERGISYTAKGKSMLTEEIGLNVALQDGGIEVFETDLGEFITQQLGRPPFHIVGPAINVPVEEIRDLFLAKAGLTEPTLDPVKLGYSVRLHLREKFKHLELGITGVNMAVAETGTVINVENEGNIRLAKSSPRTQISIMSIDKVVPTLADAAYLLRILCRNCTGQRLSSYVTFDTGPKKADETDGPEELIVIIVDNGRSDFYQDLKFREALRCIRCGACLNTCPVYAQIGGYAYGFAYSGPIGQVLNPLLLGFEKTKDLYHACTLCGACKAICPAGVDHPGLFLYYRALEAAGYAGGEAWGRRQLVALWSFAAHRRRRWNLALKLLRPLINRLLIKGSRTNFQGPLAGWLRSRDLPAIAGKTFQERWDNLDRPDELRKG